MKPLGKHKKKASQSNPLQEGRRIWMGLRGPAPAEELGLLLISLQRAVGT